MTNDDGEEILGRDPGPLPDRWLMDGMPHARGGDCCTGHGGVGITECAKCGGRLHTQGIYGGMMRVCEACGDQP